MTHRANLICKNGWKNLQSVQTHFEMEQKIYVLFTQKIMHQLYVGICKQSDVDYKSPKNKCDSRFNCQLFPTQNISKQIQPILKCLRYINDRSKDCQSYLRDKHRFETGLIQERPQIPISMQLIQYWSKLNKLVTHSAIELILSSAEKFGNSTGKTYRCIVENHESVNVFEQKLLWFQNKSMNDFATPAPEEKKDDEQKVDSAQVPDDYDEVMMNVGTYHEDNAINDFLQSLTFEPERRVKFKMRFHPN